MILVKEHKSGDSEILCMCDEDILNNLDINKKFYSGKKTNKEELFELIKHSKNINALGKEAIEFLLKHNFITKEEVKTIENIPHAHIYGL